MLVHQPHNAQDDPNNTLLSPWRGPYQVRHLLSPVVYRVSKDGGSAETSVLFGRMKPYHQRSVLADSYFIEINEMFLGTKLPMPNLDEETSPICIGPKTVERILDHKRSRGRSSPFNVQLRVRFRGEGPNSDDWYHRRQIPHSSACIRSYFASIQDVPPDPQTLTTPAPPV